MSVKLKPKQSKKVDRFVPMRTRDIRKCVDNLPADLRLAFTDAGWQGCIAGGYVRSTLLGQQVNDIDVFINAGQQTPCCPRCSTNCWEKDWDELDTDNDEHYALTLECFTPSVQIVHHPQFIGMNPKDTIRRFDVTVNQAAIWFNQQVESWTGIVAETFYLDLATKQIVMKNSWPFPATRIRRFRELGFKIPDSLIADAVAGSLMK